jgi:hypothetical protein
VKAEVFLPASRKDLSSVNRLDLTTTSGYLVADRAGRVLGRVERPMYGRGLDVADALSVRSGRLSRRRCLVPAEAIAQIDGISGVVALRFEREAIRTFLL